MRCARLPAASLAVLALAASRANGQAIDPAVVAPEGPVHAIAVSGDDIYIGGEFDFVGGGLAATGNATISPADGTPFADYTAAGAVQAIIEDGNGGYFVGGSFTAINGVPRGGLAHLRADLSVDPWNPAPDTTVFALALSNGILWVGGRFTSIAGQTRRHIAGFNAESLALTSWTLNANYDVRTLAARDSLLYVGGDFTSLGGQSRARLACFSWNGVLTNWNPGANSRVLGLLVEDEVVYAVGTFGVIGGQSNTLIAKLDRATGAAEAWGSPLGLEFWPQRHCRIVHYGDILYVSSLALRSLAAIDPSTGERLPWDPDPSPSDVRDIALWHGMLLVAGRFHTMGGVDRYNLAAFDAATGALLPWTCHAGSRVDTMVLAGDRLWLSGLFSHLNGTIYRNFAGIDAGTGQWLPWNPEVSGSISALAVGNGLVYAGGSFTSFGGEARSNLAALDPASGQVVAFMADTDDTVRTLACDGPTLYVGGDFTTIDGADRSHLAAVDGLSGAVTAWNPAPDGPVRCVDPTGGSVVVAGRFTHIGGLPRWYLAAVDPGSATATAWNPDAGFWVDVVRHRGDEIYAGGLFNTIGGATRYFAAAVDRVTAQATAWNPDLGGGTMTCLDFAENLTYVGGDFWSVGGQPQRGIAAIAPGGFPVPGWDATSTGTVDAIAVRNGIVYAGGTGTFTVGGVARSYFIALQETPVAAPSLPAPRTGFRVGPVSPNPLITSGTVRLELPSDLAVHASLFDVAGRRAVDLVKGTVLPAGSNELALDRAGLGAGVYFLRVDVGGRALAAKVVVGAR